MIHLLPIFNPCGIGLNNPFCELSDHYAKEMGGKEWIYMPSCAVRHTIWVAKMNAGGPVIP
jgi:hypothetical protein